MSNILWVNKNCNNDFTIKLNRKCKHESLKYFFLGISCMQIQHSENWPREIIKINGTIDYRDYTFWIYFHDKNIWTNRGV